MTTSLHMGSTAERTLQAMIGTTGQADDFRRRQVRPYLTEQMQSFIARQSMAFLASADSMGHCDASVRTGPEGFVRVLAPDSVAWPEYKGNGVMASSSNVHDNPHVGLLFLDFTRDHIGLHVNGSAWLRSEDELRRRHPGLLPETTLGPGRRAHFWVEVKVNEAYVHCSKHLPHLQPGPRPARDRVADSRYFHSPG